MDLQLPNYVEIETSRYCNRRCGWCPNGSYDSRRTQELMPWPLLVKVFEELKALGYKGWLAFHNYNEPLANPRLLQEIEEARARLPLCPTSLFSNGDLLTPALLNKLAEAGLNYLRVTLYPSQMALKRGDAPSLACIERWLGIKELTGYTTWVPQEVRQGSAVIGERGGLRFEVISPDLRTYNWRGGTAPAITGRSRSLPCYMTYHSASIDFRGSMKMCCNVFPEAPSHESYVIGNIGEASFEELWASKAMHQYRAAHARVDWSLSAICQGCTHHLPPEQVQKYSKHE